MKRNMLALLLCACLLLCTVSGCADAGVRDITEEEPASPTDTTVPEETAEPVQLDFFLCTGEA